MLAQGISEISVCAGSVIGFCPQRIDSALLMWEDMEKNLNIYKIMKPQGKDPWNFEIYECDGKNVCIFICISFVLNNHLKFIFKKVSPIYQWDFACTIVLGIE